MSDPVIQVEHVTKRYGAHRALDDLTFSVQSGGVVGFLGVNGAGKSTTMRILAGFMPPSDGTARICGYDVTENPLAARNTIGYLPESNPLYPELRVEEYLRFRARLKGVARKHIASAVDESITSCSLIEARHRIIGQLSKGFRQRVGLADCLLTKAPLLILDEPTVGLDPNQARETRRLIARIGQQRTVFLSTHILSDVEALCREIVIIHQGKLVAVDTPAALCARVTAPRRYRLEADGPSEAMASMLRKVEGISRVEILESGMETSLLSIEGISGIDPRGPMMAAFGAAGWSVRSLESEPVRLDDIFATLTEGVS